MFDFDADEWFFFVAAAAIVVVGCGMYYRPLLTVASLGRSIPRRLVLACLPIVSLVPTYVVLRRWADAQVVGHLDYTMLFMFGGGAWIFVASWSLNVLRLSIRDDVIERDNPAALIAACGILFGVGLVYALSNVGSGPTIWTTILPALAATVLLAAMLLLVEWIGGAVSETVTIDRDVATALRLGGAAIGSAIILGRAAAGDWASWDRTWIDLARHGWPAILVALAAGVVQRALRPTAIRPQPSALVFGIVPATLFLAAGILVVAIRR